MTKLYPPQIEGTIPAFCSSDNGTVKITVPFSMNRAVGFKDFKGFNLKLKTIQSETYLINTNSYEYDENEVHFILNSAQGLNVGQYYKIQIAYIDTNDIIGYYSTVGVIKYTSKPEVYIAGLEYMNLNSHKYNYIGVYNQEGKDITERVHTSKFKIWDNEEKLILETEDILHNRMEDTETYMSQESWDCGIELEKNKYYYIQYIVTTLNGLVVKSPKYRLMSKKSINPDLQATLSGELNFDNGYIQLNLKGVIDNQGFEILSTGNFLVSRASSKDNFNTWDNIYNFTLQSESPTRELWKDFTIEQGVSYIYSIQQYNDNGLYSERILSNEIYADFEDAFLYDGERQLKIRFNPKVTSFKTAMQESKIDTLGSKYPFIFRNGYVSYKEFPISGLISYQMDEANFFTDKEIDFSQNFTGENIYSERKFKMEVLDWLNNGQPKVFRSPSEGNYIVRLMNVSLSPNDTLGRMLHTFNCTAYEIAHFNYKSLNEMNFIQYNKPVDEKLCWETIEFQNIDKNNTYTYGLFTIDGIQYRELLKKYVDGQMISSRVAQTAIFRDMMPGTKIRIRMENQENDQIIQIGVTGSYAIETNVPIVSIKVPLNKNAEGAEFYPLDYVTGSVTYSYLNIAKSTFDTIDNVNTIEVPLRQFIGEYENIISEIENVKVKINKIFVLNFSKRPVEKAYYYNGYYFQDAAGTIPLVKDPHYIYEIQLNNSAYRYIDGNSVNKEVKYSNKVYIDGNEIDLTETETYSLKNMDNIKSIKLSSGIMLEVSYQAQNYDYLIEDRRNGVVISDQKLLERMWQIKSNYEMRSAEREQLIKDYENYLYTPSEFDSLLEESNNRVDMHYKNYIDTLTQVLEIYKEDNLL